MVFKFYVRVAIRKINSIRRFLKGINNEKGWQTLTQRKNQIPIQPCVIPHYISELISYYSFSWSFSSNHIDVLADSQVHQARTHVDTLTFAFTVTSAVATPRFSPGWLPHLLQIFTWLFSMFLQKDLPCPPLPLHYGSCSPWSTLLFFPIALIIF